MRYDRVFKKLDSRSVGVQDWDTMEQAVLEIGLRSSGGFSWLSSLLAFYGNELKSGRYHSLNAKRSRKLLCALLSCLVSDSFATDFPVEEFNASGLIARKSLVAREIFQLIRFPNQYRAGSLRRFLAIIGFPQLSQYFSDSWRYHEFDEYVLRCPHCYCTTLVSLSSQFRDGQSGVIESKLVTGRPEYNTAEDVERDLADYHTRSIEVQMLSPKSNDFDELGCSERIFDELESLIQELKQVSVNSARSNHQRLFASSWKAVKSRMSSFKWFEAGSLSKFCLTLFRSLSNQRDLTEISGAQLRALLIVVQLGLGAESRALQVLFSHFENYRCGRCHVCLFVTNLWNPDSRPVLVWQPSE